MRLLDNFLHFVLSAYLMDFGGFIGYGKGVPVGLVKEKLNGKKMYDGCARPSM